jgi:hypothetical protein
MRALKRLIPLALVSVFFAAMLAGVAACDGSGENVDPDAVLKQASANMKEIAGFHFVYEVHQPSSAEPTSGLYIARITGDVNSEGSMQSTVDATYGGIPVSIGLVAIGDTYYFQDPLNKEWRTLAAADSPVGELNLQAGTIQILERIIDTSYEGTESKGGTETYHISGKVAAAEVEAIAGAVDTTDTFPTDIWVGAEDYLVYEVDIKGAATPNEDPEIWRSIVLSDLDVFVDIQPPL